MLRVYNIIMYSKLHTYHINKKKNLKLLLKDPSASLADMYGFPLHIGISLAHNPASVGMLFLLFSLPCLHTLVGLSGGEHERLEFLWK